MVRCSSCWVVVVVVVVVVVFVILIGMPYRLNGLLSSSATELTAPPVLERRLNWSGHNFQCIKAVK